MKTRTYALILVSLFLLAAVHSPSSAQLIQCQNCVSDGSSFLCMSFTIGFVSCQAYTDWCYVATTCHGGNGGCFSAGTLVDTPGGEVAIEDLKIGDAVHSYNESTGGAVTARVVDTFRLVEYNHYLINGATRVTGGHPFWVDGEWVEARDLAVGSQLQDANGNPVTVWSIEVINHGARVYNLQVSDTGTFFANGVLVHNKTPDPQG